MGAESAPAPRSDKTMMFLPASMALPTCSRMRWMAIRSPGPPSSTAYRHGTTSVDQWLWPPGPSTSTKLASCWSVITGWGVKIWRHDSGWGSSRLPSGPSQPQVAVMISSRMASSGGLVTWANSCWK